MTREDFGYMLTLFLGLPILVSVPLYLTSPNYNYRQSFDRVIECRRFTTKPDVDVDAICGKLPQWSEFVERMRND